MLIGPCIGLVLFIGFSNLIMNRGVKTIQLVSMDGVNNQCTLISNQSRFAFLSKNMPPSTFVSDDSNFALVETRT